MSDTIVLNGRAAVRAQVTGVERWATEVLPRLKELAPALYHIELPPARMRSPAAGHLWEQALLPAVATRRRAQLVFSPANMAPRAWPRNVVVLHDAALLSNVSRLTLTYRAVHRTFGLPAARRALAVITVSEFSRHELIELAGLDPDRVHVIAGGVDARFRPEAASREAGGRFGLRGPYVLTVGTDDERKNLRALEPVARALRERSIELVWAGGRRGHFGAGNDGVSGLRAVGHVPDDDLAGLYAGARAFVMPSLYEGFGLPCLEAMACGTPVVAADRAALPEACGDAAVLVDPADSGALTEAVLAAATDPELGARLRAAGLARAAGMSWDATARAAHALLGEVAGR